MTSPARDDLVLDGTVRIAIDCMGGDHGPSVTLPAARAFLAAHPQAEVILVGRADALAAARDWPRCARTQPGLVPSGTLRRRSWS